MACSVGVWARSQLKLAAAAGRLIKLAKTKAKVVFLFIFDLLTFFHFFHFIHYKLNENEYLTQYSDFVLLLSFCNKKAPSPGWGYAEFYYWYFFIIRICSYNRWYTPLDQYPDQI